MKNWPLLRQAKPGLMGRSETGKLIKSLAGASPVQLKLSQLVGSEFCVGVG